MEGKTVGAESTFKVLLKGEPRAVTGVRKLAEGEEGEELRVGAGACEGYGVQDGAVGVFEKLAGLKRGVGSYELAVAGYYEHGGRADKAKEALGGGKKLGAPVKE